MIAFYKMVCGYVSEGIKIYTSEQRGSLLRTYSVPGPTGFATRGVSGLPLFTSQNTQVITPTGATTA
jgi:hypothetical protein